MRKRGLSADFLAVMRERLEHGRDRGYDGWESRWAFERPDADRFLDRIENDLRELRAAVLDGDHCEIREECADIANFAMMVADLMRPEAGLDSAGCEG